MLDLTGDVLFVWLCNQAMIRPMPSPEILKLT